MTHTMLRAFEQFADAENARAALLSNGFPADRVDLVVSDDEAGAVQGNFTVGNTDSTTGSFQRAVNVMVGTDKHSYVGNYDNPAFRGVYRLRVDAETEQQWRDADVIMRQFNAREIGSHR
jgi:hypothetical protein